MPGWYSWPAAKTIRPPAEPNPAPERSSPDFGAASGQRRVPTYDEHLAELAGRIPGFGGYFLDRDGKIAVYLTNPAQRARAVEVLTPVLGNRRFSARMARPVVSELRVYQGQYDFLQLRELNRRMSGVLLVPGVVFTDIDERRNRLLVAVEDAATQARIEAALVQNNVPREAVILERSAPIEDASHETLSSPVRPIPGGMRIYWERRDGLFDACSLGFNVRDPYVPGTQFFVTASHCSRRRGGGADTTRFLQRRSDNTTDPLDVIGTEVRDPGYFQQDSDPDCPQDANCRYSDALLVEYNPQSPVAPEFARIAHTTFSSRLLSGSTVISDNVPRFNIIGRYNYPISGEVVEKMGHVTGWTWGGVREGTDFLNTCVSVPRTSETTVTNLVYLCQAVVDSYATKGDSGGSVFVVMNGSDVSAIGTLLGQKTHDNDSSTHYVFSPIGGIINDLGMLYFY